MVPVKRQALRALVIVAVDVLLLLSVLNSVAILAGAHMATSDAGLDGGYVVALAVALTLLSIWVGGYAAVAVQRAKALPDE